MKSTSGSSDETPCRNFKRTTHNNEMHRLTSEDYAVDESFDVNNDRSFSRGWFAWADGLFAEAVIRAYRAEALKQGL